PAVNLIIPGRRSSVKADERGALTVTQFVEGLKAIHQNVSDFVTDAELLFTHRRWARVIFCCQIAGEEVGKYFQLARAYSDVLVDAGNVNWQRFWRRYRSHREKTKTIGAIEDMILTDAEPTREYFAELSSAASELDHGKQLAIYVDLIEGHFRCPSELF